ncbi:MAG TPA: phosphatase PAP2 family protein [bacterium]|nr:phosphatase PAP2 family protein [bacterium]
MVWFRVTAPLAVFALLTWAASFPTAHRWDGYVTAWIQRAAPFPDLPAAVLVFLGNGEVVISILVLTAAYLWRRERERGIAALGIAGGIAVLGLLGLGLKHLIVHPGPPLPYQRGVLQWGISVGTPYSFPSGHTLRTTLLAGTVFRRVPWLAVALLATMMSALIYLGYHWLSDVLGGLCLGWASVEVARAITTARSPSYRRG